MELIDSMGGDNQTAMSAWVSYGNDKEERLENQKQVKGLINFLLKNDHHTPFESSVATFRIETPIFVAREFFRHRAASYNEWSGRYSEMLPEFYVPSRTRPLQQVGKAGAYEFVAGTDAQYDKVEAHFTEVVQASWDAYQDMLGSGIAKEVARMVLPLNIYTRFYVTMNARNILHFLGLRTADQALFEIRDVAGQMENKFAEMMPYTYDAWSNK